MAWSAAAATVLGLVVLITSLVRFALLCVVTREPTACITFLGSVVIAARRLLHVAVTSAGLTCCCLLVVYWMIITAAGYDMNENNRICMQFLHVLFITSVIGRGSIERSQIDWLYYTHKSFS